MDLYSIKTRVGYLTLALTMFTTGTVGNILIMWTIARTKRLRTIQNMMVLVLAVFDFLICGYLIPFSMYVLISNREPDKQHCRFQAVINNFLFSSSVMIILLIALSRYFKICQFQRYRNIFNMKTVIAAVVFSCIVGVAFTIPLLYSDDFWLFERSMHACIFNRYVSVTYSVVCTCTLVGIPTGLTTFCYVQIYRYVTKARKQLHTHEDNGLAAKKLTYEEMVAKTQFSVFVVYMFMYFPFGILTIGGQRSNYPDGVHTMAVYMCYFNSCINCILYGVLNKNMRKAYLESMPCISCKSAVRVHPPTVSRSVLPGDTSQRQQTLESQVEQVVP